MKLKLFNLLIVCLVTVIVIYPALLICSVVWQEHLEIVLGKQNHTIKTIHWLLFLIPIGLELVIIAYHRYRNNHILALQKQVAILEQLWEKS